MGHGEGDAAGTGRSAAGVEAALAELRRGRMVLVVDDEDRENEGDLIMAAELATPAAMAFMIRHTSGLLCVGFTEERARQLRLPLMVTDSDDPRGTAFTVSVDLKVGTTTGVSARDRALTVRTLVADGTRPEDLSRPGHVFPLIAREGGVLRRAGHTESAVDLCRLAGLRPAGVLAEVTNDDGTMARRPQLARFAAEHGEFTAITFRALVDDCEHVALVLGEVNQTGAEPGSTGSAPVLVRVHSECLTGDVFASRRCDCGEQLERAMVRIGEVGRGVVVYLRGHEGRGIGLSHKLRAYNLQDAGLDTVDANLVQGLPVDSREYGIGAQILRDLGVREIRLMTNNPAKYRGLVGHGIHIAAREPIDIAPNPDNISYLTTKRTRMDHQLGAGEPAPATGSVDS